MPKPEFAKHNSKEVKKMLDKDNEYQDMQDCYDAEWWHQIDLELEQQLDEQEVSK